MNGIYSIVLLVVSLIIVFLNFRHLQKEFTKTNNAVLANLQASKGNSSDYSEIVKNTSSKIKAVWDKSKIIWLCLWGISVFHVILILFPEYIGLNYADYYLLNAVSVFLLILGIYICDIFINSSNIYFVKNYLKLFLSITGLPILVLIFSVFTIYMYGMPSDFIRFLYFFIADVLIQLKVYKDILKLIKENYFDRIYI